MPAFCSKAFSQQTDLFPYSYLTEPVALLMVKKCSVKHISSDDIDDLGVLSIKHVCRSWILQVSPISIAFSEIHFCCDNLLTVVLYACSTFVKNV